MSSGGQRVALAQEALRRADCVCFDFDSTLICEEGIDELAEFCGAGEAVRAWTSKAMEGGIKFEDALKARLELIKPSRQDVERCLEARPPTFSDGSAELVERLRSRGTKVHIVSGGFRCMIEGPALEVLGLPKEDIFANSIFWDDRGDYVGFDENEPTARDLGKPKVIAFLKKTYHNVVMIGDGATDAQAKPPADAFIAYQGVVRREYVRSKADWYVDSFADLIHALHPPTQQSFDDDGKKVFLSSSS